MAGAVDEDEDEDVVGSSVRRAGIRDGDSTELSSVV